MAVFKLQRDKTSNTTPTKMLPIEQIISEMSNSAIKNQEYQVNNSESAEVSRRSSTSTQNTDTLTPTNPINEVLGNESNLSSVETVIGANSYKQEIINPTVANNTQDCQSESINESVAAVYWG